MGAVKNGLSAVLFLFLAGCGPKVAVNIIPIETDTFISSSDFSNNSAAEYLAISRLPNSEERILAKLPSGSTQGREEQNSIDIDNVINNRPTSALGAFLLTAAIAQELLNCEATVLASGSLSSAKLFFKVVSSDETTVAGKIQLEMLSRPWWQNATWSFAHYFSLSGQWATAGGDIDSNYTAISAAQNGSDVTFDLTSYFQHWLDSVDLVHYGMVIRPVPNQAVGNTRFYSTQAAEQLRPRLVTVYSGNCINTRETTTTYQLGTSN